MTDRRFHVIFNANAGTASSLGLTAEKLQALFAENGLEAVIDADGETPLGERLERAIASDADAIVAAGGDGTITALAGALAGTGRSMAILPLGTANLLARDLGIPLDVEQAVAALASAESQQIDVGFVNGQVFLHKVVVGVIPGVAAGREHLRGRMGPLAVVGLLRYFARRLARARRLAVAITTGEGETRVQRVQALAVANNAYDEAFGRFFSRARLDGGSLTLYVLKHLTMADVMRLTAEMLLGRWREDEALSVETTTEVTIESRKPSLAVMLDGEVQTIETPLRFSISPLALSILVPPASVDESEAVEEAEVAEAEAEALVAARSAAS